MKLFVGLYANDSVLARNSNQFSVRYKNNKFILNGISYNKINMQIHLFQNINYNRINESDYQAAKRINISTYLVK